MGIFCCKQNSISWATRYAQFWQRYLNRTQPPRMIPAGRVDKITVS